jgi:hypothetical protein
MIISTPNRVVARVAGLAALIIGIAASILVWRAGLTLSHYDARAHLVVARRILDSLTPGWVQIGAVWLPLPHLLNLFPSQIDVLYRTGLSGVAMSIASYVIACAALATLIHHRTGSRAAALAGTSVLALNPNVLYLQSTPMTEALLLGLLTWSVLETSRWAERPTEIGAWRPGVLLAAACLTRYEAWPVTVAALAAAWYTRQRCDRPPNGGRHEILRVAVWPAAAIVGFFILSRATTGAWFVTGGFYVADNTALGRPFAALQQVFWGVRVLGGLPTAVMATIAAVIVLWQALRSERHRPALIALALAGTAALPVYAFFEGHPFRVRYMVPLFAAAAACVGIVVGWLPRLRVMAASLVLTIVAGDAVFNIRDAAMVREAQWDVPNSRGREVVTRCLQDRHDGEPILASMGSLAHYMHETSRAGFAIEDFLHEGNGDLWMAARSRPRAYVRWVLVEEQAEGGDELAAQSRAEPDYLAGFDRLCAGGGVALYGTTRRSGSRTAPDTR